VRVACKFRLQRGQAMYTDVLAATPFGSRKRPAEAMGDEYDVEDGESSRPVGEAMMTDCRFCSIAAGPQI
jgi:hypothetical protein